MSRDLLDLAHAALAAAIACGCTKAHVPGDVTEDHEENTYGLPDGIPIRKELRRKFREQLKRMVGFVDKIGDELPATFPKMRDTTEAMAASMTPILGTYWDRAGKGLRSRMGLDPDEWRVTDPNIHRAIAQQAFRFCDSTNRTTDLGIAEARDAIRDQLARGLIGQGETIPELTKRVKSVFTRASDSRASTIARTEAARAVHSAAEMSAQGTGLNLVKEWLLSANSCPICVDLAAKVPKAALGATFGRVGRDATYSDVKMPPAHPNCRCSVSFEVVDGTADAGEGDEPEKPEPIPAFVPAPKKPDPEPTQAIASPTRIPPGPIGERIKAYREGPGKAKLDALAAIDTEPDAKRLKALNKARDDARKALDKVRNRKGSSPEQIAEAERLWREAGDRAHEYTFESHRVSGQVLDVLSLGPGEGVHIATRTPGQPPPVNAAAAERWLARTLAAEPGKPGGIAIDYEILPDDGRAHHIAASKQIAVTRHEGESIILHEFGHAIEDQFPEVFRRSSEFLDHRVGDEPLRKLKDLFPGSRYEDHEVGRSDQFGRAFDRPNSPLPWYCGKEYSEQVHPYYPATRRRATEILSMGIQKLREDPVGFARKDPEYCAYVLGILDGQLR